ncbi:flagellar basal body rod protein FlgB [Anaerosporomusa subterranea]|uniref:flagellar basal body rod protein FlgB n=1 Tax=Anaerosporomusa subterranea TaxID=1794912 RepID=UPI001E426874|nr:flagellar basal body rod protein FlgB [Anaerosporomusa subterranea]
MNILSSAPHAALLEQAIAAASVRHKVIADNIANVNTPGFKRSEVRFEDALREEMDSKKKKLPMSITHERHIGQIVRSNALSPQIRTVTENSYRTDGNNVDIEIEMANMAKNTIYYDATVQQLSRHYSSIKSAINEGRR